MEADGREGEADQISFRSERHPRDLLRRFSGGIDEQLEAAGGSSDEIDLSLCLSLGGSLGVDSEDNKLVRSSSSIAALTMHPIEKGFQVVAPVMRACSLPTEAEENRKRKELQSLKRLEVKRKRLEKRDLWPVAAAREQAEAAGSVGAACRTVDAAVSFPPISQGSIGSQGSTATAVSNFESQPMQGFDASGLRSRTGAKNASTVLSLPREHTSDGRSASTKAAGEVERNMMEEMPCVSTKGEGPNGRRIEGFLYRYRKGEDVRIVCVCHGSFLSPAQFIRHAGGGDVAHPLKHIVVNPLPSTLL